MHFTIPSSEIDDFDERIGHIFEQVHSDPRFETSKLVNLSSVSMNTDPISLTFLYHDDVTICGVHGLFKTPACGWLRYQPDLDDVKEVYESILCEENFNFNTTYRIKTMPCEVGKSPRKLFYEGARDLKHYIELYVDGRIPYNDHKAIFTILSQWDEFRNHNLDVPVLHFK
jgi:hypothetical protein